MYSTYCYPKGAEFKGKNKQACLAGDKSIPRNHFLLNSGDNFPMITLAKLSSGLILLLIYTWNPKYLKP